MDKVLFSHSSDDWATPCILYDLFMSRGYVDPCPLHCDQDALSLEWPYTKKYFINPPYSKIKEFVAKFGDDIRRDAWWLVPSRTDTKWFKRLFDYASCIVFINGRLRFNDGATSAPFPSVLIHWSYSDRGAYVGCVHRDNLISTLEWLFKYY